MVRCNQYLLSVYTHKSFQNLQIIAMVIKNMKKQHTEIAHITESFSSFGAYQNNVEILENSLYAGRKVIYIH